MTATAIRAERVKRQFALDFPFTKSIAAETDDLLITGYASTWGEDRDGDFIDPKAYDEDLHDYLSKNPILLYQHGRQQPLGQVQKATPDGHGLFVECLVPKPMEGSEPWKFTAYDGIKRGILRTFSVGGYFHYDVTDIGTENEKWTIVRVELLEISVVSIPANPDCLFDAAMKALHPTDSGDKPMQMSEASHAQMLQLLGVEAIADEKLLAMDESAREVRYAELGVLFRRVTGKEAPSYEAFRSILTDLGDKPDLPTQLKALPQVNALIELLHAPAKAVTDDDSKADGDQAEGALVERVAALEATLAALTAGGDA